MSADKKQKTKAPRTGRPTKLNGLEKQIVVNMYREGKSLTEIGYLNKVSVPTVSRIIKAHKDALEK